MIMKQLILPFAALAAQANPALAQSITCDDLSQLQVWGKARFGPIVGEKVDQYVTKATFTLPGAERCELDYTNTTYATYRCVWSGFPDLESSEAARLDLKTKVVACLPNGYKIKDRSRTTATSEGISTYIKFGDLQPQITIARTYFPKNHHHLVRFEFQMNLHEDQ